MINSISNTTQLYATSKVSKTTAVSAYSEVSSTKPLSRMEQMQEKYKDVYSPMPPSYSKEVEDLQVSLMREKYPDYLPLEQLLEKYVVKIDIDNPKSKEELAILQKEKTAKIVQEQGEDYYTRGIYDPKRASFEKDILTRYPNNRWDMTKKEGISNSKELASCYNAGVYEGLESGKSLEDAQTIAGHTVIDFMDISEYWDFSNMHKRLAAQDDSSSSNQNFQYDNNSVNYNNRIDLREYGFDMEVGTTNIYNNEQSMVVSIQSKLDYYNFILTNQDTVKNKYDNLDNFKTNNVSFDEQIIKPIQERYKPEAELALSVFSKYKIFNSIDIRA